MTKSPRVVLITSGLRRVAHYFPSLSGQTIGIINWNNIENPKPSLLSHNALTRKCHALLRRRQYGTLQHLSLDNNLLFADIFKGDEETLRKTLLDWQANLVITSNCSFVPTAALAHLSHGSLNMHPSWLPDYRGAEPVLWQVFAGEPFLATSIHRLSDEYDCGGIVAQEKTERPTGASQASLANITEGKLGKALLNRAIELVTEQPDLTGTTQPKKSATPYARRLSADVFAAEHPLNTLKVKTVWDLIHYYGKCPAPWLGLSGWRNKLDWEAVSFSEENQDSASGLSVALKMNDGTIILKPKSSSLLKLLKS